MARNLATCYASLLFFWEENQSIIKYINKKKVTKAEVISEIADKTGIDKADVQATIEAFFKVVKDSMAEGNNIYVRGFGSFVNKKRAKKVARNISKNTSIIIDEHFIPSFKPSKTFIQKIKNSKKIKELAHS